MSEEKKAKVIIKRTHKDTGFIEYRTGNAGGWSGSQEEAFPFSKKDVSLQLSELKKEPDASAFEYSQGE